MSWHCPTCGVAHARQHNEPKRCEACEVTRGYEARIAELRTRLDDALSYLSSEQLREWEQRHGAWEDEEE